jgi:hypothetical protein
VGTKRQCTCVGARGMDAGAPPVVSFNGTGHMRERVGHTWWHTGVAPALVMGCSDKVRLVDGGGSLPWICGRSTCWRIRRQSGPSHLHCHVSTSARVSDGEGGSFRVS